MSSVFCPKAELVAQIEFTEWTPDGHLTHSKFVGLREDKLAGRFFERQIKVLRDEYFTISAQFDSVAH
ncbi:MAG: hypothetical protein DME76_19250 [Verrucomicrobia bacterium]|nr:MAG: hypothetical protein DME76_19250 [Verrucomicrobiota bacterium]